ncbi:hypothetical protein PFUGPA_01126 [Plasmodium falciparum Palo Alto/Uganda]|uniref:Uncharacterized protein n=2 Tax=Plasmodium falciparum TaxID=5833 RepID=W4J3Z6_PLAFP|nr:hypothetical protein PFUGPA_01126 [Plasmodium falciparum Palo Alto/Uganda]ETW61831.1 hypothetical protein PFMC_02300 [Plasmodium falciparum CAMP/Malaysia]
MLYEHILNTLLIFRILTKLLLSHTMKVLNFYFFLCFTSFNAKNICTGIVKEDIKRKTKQKKKRQGNMI